MKIAILLFISNMSFAQGFYDLETIQTIEVEFAESNWDQLMDIAYADDTGYVQAQSVTINGITYDSIGVKYKGNSSYKSNQVKNPWHIELDTYKDQEYEGYTDIKLSNGYKDPSCLREVLGYEIIRQYMDAPLANYANLYVNGQLIGLYSNVESVSKKFVKSRFGSKNNTFVKCNPPEGAGPQSNDFPNLVYMGQDSTAYYDAYEIKSDAGWKELIDLCDTLANNIEVIDEILDVDRVLWMLAFDNVTVNLDSYIGAFSQNYYLYRDDYDRFLPVIWDLNESFGVFSMTGSSSLNNTTAKRQMSHLLHENDNDFPLVQKLISIPTYRRMYLAHIKTIIKENFENGSYYDTGLAIQAVIDEAVQADNNKFYTYANFVNNLTADVGGGGGGPGGGGSAPGITSLMNGRSDYLLNLTDFTQTEPAITDITLSNDEPVYDETISINAAITDADYVYMGYRESSKTAPFNKVQMYDDGMHNDGAANDGIYGINLLVENASTQYYVYAENDNIGKFSPERAEYEYHEISATIINEVLGDVVINELLASNTATQADQDGEFDDWVEIYNNGTESIDLSGYFLTDDETDLGQWSFPEGTVIDAGGYLIVWADNDIDQEGLHANFKLSSSGEALILSDVDTTMVDAVEFDEQTDDIAFARKPNGTGDFEYSAPTFNDNNDNAVDCTGMGGDMDNDGICGDLDCDDSDPTIGAMQEEGTACDDGDANTFLDVIQADGCTCEGETFDISDLVINELLASNAVTQVDQDGEFDDWIELYNNGNTAVDLSGYFLTDDGTDLGQWSFPEGTVIDANGYLVVWADNDVDQEGLHANFRLSGSGESLILSDADTMIVDAIEFGEQTDDISYGRFPNGTGDFRLMTPTYNAENVGTTSTNEVQVSDLNFKTYPNPASDQISVSCDEKMMSITIYTINGKQVLQAIPLSNEVTINSSTMANGMYYLRVITGKNNIVTQKIVVQK